MAIVTDLFTGNHGRVRVVILRLRSGKETTRRILAVYPLEVQANIDTPFDYAELCTTENSLQERRIYSSRRKKLNLSRRLEIPSGKML